MYLEESPGAAKWHERRAISRVLLGKQKDAARDFNRYIRSASDAADATDRYWSSLKWISRPSSQILASVQYMPKPLPKSKPEVAAAFVVALAKVQEESAQAIASLPVAKVDPDAVSFGANFVRWLSDDAQNKRALVAAVDRRDQLGDVIPYALVESVFRYGIRDPNAARPWDELRSDYERLNDHLGRVTDALRRRLVADSIVVRKAMSTKYHKEFAAIEIP
jgi:hypothetical protein